MKRTFLTKRNALVSSTNLSWGGYALVVAVFLLLVRLLAPNFFWHVLTPVFHVSNSLATESHTLFSSFGETAALALQNEKLQRENTALALENQALIQEEKSLEGLSSTASGTLASGILAGVLARPPESPYDILMLAKGSRAGMTTGMEAFGPGGVPIGFVTAVLPDFSRVTLFSSPRTRTTGSVGRAAVPLIIVGLGGGVMTASIARSAGISVGDIVWAPGPGLLPIGKVVDIGSDPSSPSVTLRIMPVLNLFSVSWVVVRDVGSTLLNAFSQATTSQP